MTASIGLAEFSGNRMASWQQLVELADKRMYAAKQGGRNRIACCEVGEGETRANPGAGD